MKRLFIGIPIESKKVAIQAEIWKNDSELNENVLKWVNSENWHITLIFLGSTSESAISQLQELIEESFADVRAFTTNLKGLGVFPDLHNPKVLWLGIENIRCLIPATSRMGEWLQQSGFLLENKPLKPHLTLARIKNSAHRIAIHSLIERYSNFDFDQVVIDRVILYESVSTPGGPVYKPLFVKMLAGN